MTRPAHAHDPGRDGDHREWLRRQQEDEVLAAQAQQEWEASARADAEAWARREAAKPGASAEGDADEA